MGKNTEGKFNVAVGAIIENRKTGKILLLKRSSRLDFTPGIWEQIAGRLKQFEDPEDGLRREVKEEAGLNIEIVKPIRVFHIFRGEKAADNELVGVMYWCKTDSEKVKLSDEHTDFKWVLPEDAMKWVTHEGIRKDFECFFKEKNKG